MTANKMMVSNAELIAELEAKESWMVNYVDAQTTGYQAELRELRTLLIGAKVMPTNGKMMPTHGKKPEGLSNFDMLWVQWKPLDGCYREIECIGVSPLTPWENIEAYCVIPEPAPYVPEPDYSKWIGKPCWFGHAENKEEVCSVLEKYVVGERNPFRTHLNAWPWCRPVTADEIVKE